MVTSMTSHSFIKFKEVADNFRVVEVKEHRKKVIFLIEGAYRGGISLFRYIRKISSKETPVEVMSFEKSLGHKFFEFYEKFVPVPVITLHKIFKLVKDRNR